MKFVIGLTNVEEHECYRYDERQLENEVRYNLYKLTPEIEQDTITWDINTAVPGFVNSLRAWEETIRRPHLNMTGIAKKPNNYDPAEYDISLSMQFINLIPTDPRDFYSELVEDDFSEISQGGFGNLSIDFMNSISQISDYEYDNTLNKAFYADSLERLIPRDQYRPLAIPYYRANFVLGSDFKRSKKMSFRYFEWLQRNKSKLEELGYDINHPTIKTGELVVGTLSSDPWEQYQKLKKYTRICRFSFVE